MIQALEAEYAENGEFITPLRKVADEYNTTVYQVRKARKAIENAGPAQTPDNAPDNAPAQTLDGDILAEISDAQALTEDYENYGLIERLYTASVRRHIADNTVTMNASAYTDYEVSALPPEFTNIVNTNTIDSNGNYSHLNMERTTRLMQAHNHYVYSVVQVVRRIETSNGDKFRDVFYLGRVNEDEDPKKHKYVALKQVADKTGKGALGVNHLVRDEQFKAISACAKMTRAASMLAQRYGAYDADNGTLQFTPDTETVEPAQTPASPTF